MALQIKLVDSLDMFRHITWTFHAFSGGFLPRSLYEEPFGHDKNPAGRGMQLQLQCFSPEHVGLNSGGCSQLAGLAVGCWCVLTFITTKPNPECQLISPLKIAGKMKF